MFRRPLDLGLVVLFIVSIALIFVSHEDPFVRNWLCAKAPCREVSHSAAWLKIIYDLSIASLVSLAFYGLVVRLPDYQRRRRIRRSFADRYRRFKEDTIGVILAVADGTYDASLPESLVDPEQFKNYFQERVSSSQDRWHRFLNNLDEYHLRRLLTLLEIFRDEIVFVLSSTDIQDRKPFEFLKRLSAAIRSMRDVTVGYDEAKPLESFLWEVLAGWSFITGYQGDVVGKMIKSI
jgi:hypothetical protein